MTCGKLHTPLGTESVFKFKSPETQLTVLRDKTLLSAPHQSTSIGFTIAETGLTHCTDLILLAIKLVHAPTHLSDSSELTMATSFTS